jgi:CBS domain-containing protein
VTPETPVKEVVQHLAQENRCVLVMSGQKLLGIVTERDILFKVMDKKRDLEKIPISEIMTPNPETLKLTDKIVHALNKMSIGGFRHIPIVDGEKKIRVISVRDILAYLAEMFPGVVGIHQ